MNSKSNRNIKFLHNQNEENNFLKYIQYLKPEIVAQLSKPENNDVLKVMEQNIMGMLGNLPPEQFNTTITTNRENFGKLLISAMMTGYFLRNAEQRMNFEQSLMSLSEES